MDTLEVCPDLGVYYGDCVTNWRLDAATSTERKLTLYTPGGGERPAPRPVVSRAQVKPVTLPSMINPGVRTQSSSP